jgi:hypothetical protein
MDGIWSVLEFLEKARCDACKKEKEEVQEVRRPDGRTLRLCWTHYRTQIRLEKASPVDRNGGDLINNGDGRDASVMDRR